MTTDCSSTCRTWRAPSMRRHRPSRHARPPVPATGHPRAYQRLALVGVAAAMVGLVGVLAWSALDDEDAAPVVVSPGPTTSTTVPTAPADFDWNALPETGIALQPLDGPLQLLSLEGDVLGTAPSLVAVNGPRLVAWPGQVEAEPIGAAEVPSGCTSAEAGGGLRVAVCGPSGELPQRIELVDSAGQATVLVDGLPRAGTSEPLVGHWRWATPSPDGRWVLAQWSAECEVPIAFIADVATGALRTVTGEAGADWVGAPTSTGLGWLPDGRAAVWVRDSACGAGASAPGVHLLDPATSDLELVAPTTVDSDQAFLWTKRASSVNGPERLVSDALRALGLEACCGEPSHGGAGVTSGAVFDGYDIGINGGPAIRTLGEQPAGDSQRLPLLRGEATVISGRPDASTIVAFTCGANTWWMSWWDDGTPEVDSMLLLAEALVPHLACTLGPPPDA